MKTIIIHDNSVVTDVKPKTCRIDGKLVKWTCTIDSDWDNKRHVVLYTLTNAQFSDGTNSGQFVYEGEWCDQTLTHEPHRIFFEIREGKNQHDNAKVAKQLAYQKKKEEERKANLTKNTMTAFEFRKEVYRQTGYVLDYKPYSSGKFRIWTDVTDLVISDKTMRFDTGRHIANVDVNKDFSQAGIQKVIDATKKEALAEYKKMVKAIDKLK